MTLQTDYAEGLNAALGTYINQHVTAVHLPDVLKVCEHRWPATALVGD
jgi:hypothetical protein